MITLTMRLERVEFHPTLYAEGGATYHTNRDWFIDGQNWRMVFAGNSGEIVGILAKADDLRALAKQILDKVGE